HGDRPLTGGLEVDDDAALRLVVAEARPDVEPESLELISGAMAKLVVAERGEERRLTGQPRELHRRHGSTSGRGPPSIGDVGDLTAGRQMRHPQELRPLNVTDDRQSERGEAISESWLQIPAGKHVSQRVFGVRPPITPAISSLAQCA